MLYDACISYSQKNRQFIQKFAAALGQNDRRIWVDFSGIGASTKWRAEILSAIVAANVFVFVVSGDSIVSEALSPL
jgi:hypothetical protein